MRAILCELAGCQGLVSHRRAEMHGQTQLFNVSLRQYCCVFSVLRIDQWCIDFTARFGHNVAAWLLTS